MGTAPLAWMGCVFWPGPSRSSHLAAPRTPRTMVRCTARDARARVAPCSAQASGSRQAGWTGIPGESTATHPPQSQLIPPNPALTFSCHLHLRENAPCHRQGPGAKFKPRHHQLRAGFAAGNPLCYHCRRMGGAHWEPPVGTPKRGWRKHNLICSRVIQKRPRFLPRGIDVATRDGRNEVVHSHQACGVVDRQRRTHDPV